MGVFEFIYDLSRKTRSLLLAALLGLLVLVSAYGGVRRVRDVEGFLAGTQLDGEDISGKPVKEIVAGVNDRLADARVELTEEGETVLKGSLADFGHDFDEQAFQETLTTEEEKQKHSLVTTLRRLVESTGFVLTDYYADDETQLASFLLSSKFSVPRVRSEEAHLEFNQEEGLYEVVPAVQGNEIDDEKLQQYVDQVLDDAVQEGTFLENPLLTISIPKDVYSSEIVQTDTSALDKEALEKNRKLQMDALKDVTVTYTFGSQTEVLDSSTIAGWVRVNDDLEIILDEEKVAEYISGLAGTYNTRGCDRVFIAYDGRITHIKPEVNVYGYMINEEAEVQALQEDILSGEPVTREPVYYTGDGFGRPIYHSREGKDDINGTYIEVSITRQHLWFYREGKLVVESDVVTGNAGSSETETVTGCYPLVKKNSPATLTGANSVDYWSSEVDYWMAFNPEMGQGLHDAPWRSEFGGDIYKTDGSHGCVNLPSDTAGIIYDNVETGTAVIIHQ